MSKQEPIIEKKLGIPPDYQYKALKSSNFIHSNWHQNKLDTLETILNLSKKDRVLDIGIGSGNFELAFAGKVKEIVGIDYNEEAVEFAKELLKSNKIKNVKLRTADAKKINKLKGLGKFDLVIMVDVIEHFKLSDAKQIISNFSNVLKKDGKVCLVTPNFNSTWVTLEWILDKFKLAPELGGKQHLSKFSPNKLTEILTVNGYNIDCLATFNSFSYFFPFQKIRRKINGLEVKYFKYGNMLAIVATK